MIQKEIGGLITTNSAYKPSVILITISKDERGETLALASEELGVQFTIPVERVSEFIHIVPKYC